MLAYFPLLVILEANLVVLDRIFNLIVIISLVNWISCPFADSDRHGCDDCP